MMRNNVLLPLPDARVRKRSLQHQCPDRYCAIQGWRQGGGLSR